LIVGDTTMWNNTAKALRLISRRLFVCQSLRGLQLDLADPE
jgi:hypothetical protein